jgi:hypothetical protein
MPIGMAKRWWPAPFIMLCEFWLYMVELYWYAVGEAGPGDREGEVWWG